MKKFTWPEIVSLRIKYHNFPISLFCNKLKISKLDLHSATVMYDIGILDNPIEFCVDDYIEDFTLKTTIPEVIIDAAHKTKSLRKLPGRKTNKTQIALLKIPTTPIPINEYAELNNISIHCLTQHKRFLKFDDNDLKQLFGEIIIKKSTIFRNPPIEK